MAANDKKIESTAEYISEREIQVRNSGGHSEVVNGTTGQESYQISDLNGNTIKLSKDGITKFTPNNDSSLTHGNTYSTTRGDTYTTSNNHEITAKADVTVITGPPEFITNPIVDNWVETYQPVATAKAAPEYNYGAIGNNTGTVFEDGGTPEEGSGAVQGGTYEPSKVDIPALLESTAPELARIERQMGKGGNVRVLSMKDIVVVAGTKAIAFDSGVTVPNGKPVTQKVISVDGELQEVKTSVPIHESKDTSGAVPWGNIDVKAMTKFNMTTGSGGLSIKSAGEANINSTGRLMLGGSEVAIGGSSKEGYGRVTINTDRDVFIKSDKLVTIVAPNVNIHSNNQITHITPEAMFTGNLHVQGNLTVTGYIHAKGDIVAGKGSTDISLLNHTHTDTPGTGAGETSPPIPK